MLKLSLTQHLSDLALPLCIDWAVFDKERFRIQDGSMEDKNGWYTVPGGWYLAVTVLAWTVTLDYEAGD